MSDICLPPANTTTASLYFTSTDGAPRMDSSFTVRGILLGKQLSEWIRILTSEHGNAQLNATIDVWHHHPDGSFDHSEITTSRMCK